MIPVHPFASKKTPTSRSDFDHEIKCAIDTAYVLINKTTSYRVRKTSSSLSDIDNCIFSMFSDPDIDSAKTIVFNFCVNNDIDISEIDDIVSHFRLLYSKFNVPCSRFKLDVSKISNHTSIKSFVESEICTDCNVHMVFHKHCDKFTSNSHLRILCDTCSTHVRLHSPCSTFTSPHIKYNCTICLKSSSDHDKFKFDSGLYPCDVFMPNENYTICTNCNFTVDNHKYTALVHKLNPKTIDVINKILEKCHNLMRQSSRINAAQLEKLRKLFIIDI